MTLFSLNVSYDIIYHLRLFPQNQTSGLQPTGGDQDCILLDIASLVAPQYHFNDVYCHIHYAPLCEAPLLALSDGTAQEIF